MDGTTPLIINRVGVINRTHAFAKPMVHGHPRLRFGDGFPVPGFPRLFMTDICTGSDHLTLTKIQDWQVTSGEFDPFDLFGSVLKRHTNANAQATQQLDNIQTGVTYSISVSGTGVVSFTAPIGTTYSWGVNHNTFADETKTVTFTGGAPTAISIKLENNSHEIDAISMTEQNTTTELITNMDFVNTEEQFYDIESWYVDSEDERIVPHTTLGYLQGFNDTQIFTIFE